MLVVFDGRSEGSQQRLGGNLDHGQRFSLAVLAAVLVDVEMSGSADDGHAEDACGRLVVPLVVGVLATDDDVADHDPIVSAGQRRGALLRRLRRWHRSSIVLVLSLMILTAVPVLRAQRLAGPSTRASPVVSGWQDCRQRRLRV